MVIQNFRESRELLDLKQKDIANFFNIHFSTVSGWETGKDTIPLNRLIEYANKYDFAKGNWDIYIIFFELAFNL